MPKKRSYRLLCPIARALDKVGDRWTLLILRDLHAGPARYMELQTGLTGLASNLLASRLNQLQEDGLVRQTDGPHGTQLYALTPEGEATAPLLFELGNYGSRFAPPEDLRRPGNLRTIVVNLKESLRRSVDANSNARAELVVDEEFFAVRVDEGRVTVRYGADPEAPVSLSMGYEALIDTVDGRMPSDEFASEHLEATRGTAEDVGSFLGLLAGAFAGAR
ncbi:MAG: helix-turn-helix transcriptional regulator [Deltaproteobacteria bacterium]|nr:helix-turn-helix transcriptional regulator [Deltaproteobacteria bacterium]